MRFKKFAVGRIPPHEAGGPKVKGHTRGVADAGRGRADTVGWAIYLVVLTLGHSGGELALLHSMAGEELLPTMANCPYNSRIDIEYFPS